MCIICENKSAVAGAGPAPAMDACKCGAPETLRAYARIEADLSRREMLGGAAAVSAMFAGFNMAPDSARAQGGGSDPRPVLLTDLRLFDGRAPEMREDVDILVEGDRITALPQRGTGPEDARRIDCGGRAVIPGLIDAHWHATLCGIGEMAAMTADPAYVHLVAAQAAGDTLRRGFTTVRDVGGPAFALKRAIDERRIEGPRVFPSGAMISQTSGHGDFRMIHELPRTAQNPLSHAEEMGASAIADGEDAVLMRAREQLMKGASQLKLMAGGGVSSLYDPLEAPQYFERELRVAVDAAADWGTYVCVHVYSTEGVRRAIRAGVKCIEHGQLVDEDMRAWHAGAGQWGGVTDVNSHSIGIELANTAAHPYPAPQMAALEDLLVGLMRRWRIAPARVIGHSDMAPARKSDPGPRFDWRALACQGLSVWPRASRAEAASMKAFLRDAATFGYRLQRDAGPDEILRAFRMRFRPGRSGQLEPEDCAMIADLAARFPVDRDTTTA